MLLTAAQERDTLAEEFHLWSAKAVRMASRQASMSDFRRMEV